MVDDFYFKFLVLLKDCSDLLELMEYVEVWECGELYNLLFF